VVFHGILQHLNLIEIGLNCVVCDSLGRARQLNVLVSLETGIVLVSKLAHFVGLVDRVEGVLCTSTANLTIILAV